MMSSTNLNSYEDVIIELYEIIRQVDCNSRISGTNHDSFHITTLHTISKRIKYQELYEHLKAMRTQVNNEVNSHV